VIYEDEKLRSFSSAQIHQIYQNARKKDSDPARSLARRIEDLGLLVTPAGGMSTSHPTYIRMREIIYSSEGITAATAAACSGVPALAGVEPMIIKDLGDAYAQAPQGTLSAGGLVGELMASKGYMNKRQVKMPDGSVAHTAALWVPRSSGQ
jgi:hypothetical protein